MTLFYICLCIVSRKDFDTMKDRRKVAHLLKQISNQLDSADEHDTLVGFAVATKIIYSQGIFLNIKFNGIYLTAFTFAEKGVGDIILNSQSAHQLQRH